METSGLITLQSCVDDVLNKYEESEAQVSRYLRFAERGVAKLSLFTLPNVQTKTLKVNRRINIASLPSDFNRLVRLGVNLNGKIYTLTNDEDILLTDGGYCDATEHTKKDYDNVNGALCDWHYQIRGGYSEYGTYRLNMNDFTIHFGDDVLLDEVIIEYTGSGIKKGEKTYIPEIARETIIAFISKERLHNGNSTINERMEAKQAYSYELAMLESAMMPSIDEIYDTLLGLSTPLITR